MKRIKEILLLVFLSVIVHGCVSDREPMALMDCADNVLDTMPDSALCVLHTLSPSDLKTAEGKARYSLLMTLALLKTGCDFNGDSMLSEAYAYYGHTVQPSREAMLTHFAKAAFTDSFPALKEYDRAISLSAGQGNHRYRALSYFNKCSVYAATRRFQDAREAVNLGLREAASMEDKYVLGYGLNVSGTVYNQIGNSTKAFEEFSKGKHIADSIDNGELKQLFAQNIAYTSSLLGHHHHAVQLYDSLLNTDEASLSLPDVFAYIRSLIWSGHMDKAHIILESVECDDDGSKMNKFYTLSQYYEAKGEYAESIEAIDSFHHYENMMVKSDYNNDLAYAQTKELKAETAINAESLQIKEHNLSILKYVLIAGILLLIVVGFKYRQSKNAIKHEKQSNFEDQKSYEIKIDSLKNHILDIERINKEIQLQKSELEETLCAVKYEMTLSKESFSLLEQELNRYKEICILNKKTLESEKTLYKAHIAERDYKLKDYEQQIIALKDCLLFNFKAVYSAYSEYCNRMPDSCRTKKDIQEYELKRDIIIKEFKNDTFIAKISFQIDELMEGILTMLRKDGGLNDVDMRIVIYDILGFSYTSIASLLDITDKAASIRRSRVKGKLSEMSADLSGICSKYIKMLQPSKRKN